MRNAGDDFVSDFQEKLNELGKKIEKTERAQESRRKRDVAENRERALTKKQKSTGSKEETTEISEEKVNNSSALPLTVQESWENLEELDGSPSLVMHCSNGLFHGRSIHFTPENSDVYPSNEEVHKNTIIPCNNNDPRVGALFYWSDSTQGIRLKIQYQRDDGTSSSTDSTTTHGFVSGRVNVLMDGKEVDKRLVASKCGVSVRRGSIVSFETVAQTESVSINWFMPSEVLDMDTSTLNLYFNCPVEEKTFYVDLNYPALECIITIGTSSSCDVVLDVDGPEKVALVAIRTNNDGDCLSYYELLNMTLGGVNWQQLVPRTKFQLLPGIFFRFTGFIVGKGKRLRVSTIRLRA